jgi:cell division protein FtsW
MNIGDPFHFALRQCVFAAAAAAVILISVSMLEPRGDAAHLIHLGGAIAIMIALPFIGHNAKGATRWLRVRRLHPAAVGVHEAGAGDPGRLDVRRGAEGRGRAGRLHRLRPLRHLRGLLLIQPDIGQTVLITVAFGAAFWMAGVPMSWVMRLGAVAVAGLASTYFLFPTWPAACTASSRRTRPTPTR